VDDSVDTGKEEADWMLCGSVRVIVGYHERMTVRVSA
jgi:predicted polyphosphate/ATP-dependent NAD kinase